MQSSAWEAAEMVGSDATSFAAAENGPHPRDIRSDLL